MKPVQSIFLICVLYCGGFARAGTEFFSPASDEMQLLALSVGSQIKVQSGQKLNLNKIVASSPASGAVRETSDACQVGLFPASLQVVMTDKPIWKLKRVVLNISTRVNLPNTLGPAAYSVYKSSDTDLIEKSKLGVMHFTSDSEPGRELVIVCSPSAFNVGSLKRMGFSVDLIREEVSAEKSTPVNPAVGRTGRG